MAGIFHAYDVRGVVPKDIDELVSYKLGIAVARYFRSKKVLVGIDARTSGPVTKKYFCLGLEREGVTPIDVGMISSGMSYYVADKYPSIMITASHNPKEYNGFKINKPGHNSIGLGFGLEKIEAIYNSLKDVSLPKNNTPIKVVCEEQTSSFCKFVSDLVSVKRPIKAVVDPSNGVMGPIIQKIGAPAKINLVFINDAPDGDFPGHGPNPLLAGATDAASKKVIRENADFGVVFDNDGDRAIFIDNKGNTMPAECTSALVARHMLKTKKAAVVYDCASADIIATVVKDCGGTPVESEVGRASMLDHMLKSNAIFGSEFSGHFYFGDFFHEDSGEMVFAKMAELLSVTKEPLSAMLEMLGPLYKWNDNISAKEPKALLAAIEKEFGGGKATIDRKDGVKIRTPTFWILARGSNTEPMVRIYLEAKSKKILDDKISTLKLMIK